MAALNWLKDALQHKVEEVMMDKFGGKPSDKTGTSAATASVPPEKLSWVQQAAAEKVQEAVGQLFGMTPSGQPNGQYSSVSDKVASAYEATRGMSLEQLRGFLTMAMQLMDQAAKAGKIPNSQYLAWLPKARDLVSIIDAYIGGHSDKAPVTSARPQDSLPGPPPGGPPFSADYERGASEAAEFYSRAAAHSTRREFSTNDYPPAGGAGGFGSHVAPPQGSSAYPPVYGSEQGGGGGGYGGFDQSSDVGIKNHGGGAYTYGASGYGGGGQGGGVFGGGAQGGSVFGGGPGQSVYERETGKQPYQVNAFRSDGGPTAGGYSAEGTGGQGHPGQSAYGGWDSRVQGNAGQRAGGGNFQNYEPSAPPASGGVVSGGTGVNEPEKKQTRGATYGAW